MITEDYVSFETAELLKERGFNEKCRAFYVLHASGEARFCISTSYEEGWNYNKEENFVFSAPTLQMAMKWLRVMHDRYIEISRDTSADLTGVVFRVDICDGALQCLHHIDGFPTYEEACDGAMKYCLENLIK